MKTYKLPLAFLAVIVIWSSTPLAIQWSSTSAPMSSVMVRMLIGVLFCLALMGLLGLRLPMSEQARRLYVVGGLSMFVSMTLVYKAAQSIPSGWISVMFGLSPLVTGLIGSFVEPDNKLTISRCAGILLGIIGLFLVFQAGLSFDPNSLPAIILLLISVLISSFSSVVIRQLGKSEQFHPMQTATGGLIVAIPFFILVVYLLEPTLIAPFHGKALYSILYLGIVGTGIGFTLYYFLLKQMPASKVALITLITPITSLLLGSALNNEPMLHEIWYGASFVIAGLLLYQFAPSIRFKLHL